MTSCVNCLVFVLFKQKQLYLVRMRCLSSLGNARNTLVSCMIMWINLDICLFGILMFLKRFFDALICVHIVSVEVLRYVLVSSSAVLWSVVRPSFLLTVMTLLCMLSLSRCWIVV